MTQDQLNKIPESIHIEGDYKTREVKLDGKKLSPEKSLKVINHSPDGFNWGYGGSGPAQLALAILLEFLPKEEAQCIHQSLKWEYVSIWPQQDLDQTIPLREWVKNEFSDSILGNV